MIKTFYFNDLRTCCYVLWDDTKECVIVDAGCYSDSEHDRLVKFVEENGFKPVKLLNTHGHFDHVMGNAFVLSKWNIPSYLNKGDLPQIARSKSYGGYFGYEFADPGDNFLDLNDEDVITYGDSSLKVYYTPGHSRGGVIFYNKKESFVLSGDSLFAGSIGRTDLPGGDYDDLIKSIKTKLLVLPPETQVYPGHGPSTTIGEEIAGNPFLV